MRLLRHIFVALLLCVLTTGPGLACVAAFSQMSKAEMACCKKMAGDCGAMKNAEHSCCQKSTVSAADEALISGPQISSGIVILALPQPALSATAPAFQQSYEVLRQSHSPPRPNGSSLILRI